MTRQSDPAIQNNPDERGGTHPVLARLGYAVALLVAAAGSLVLEIVAARLLAPYVGMSIYTWTSIIAVVLAGLSIGHWIGGHLAERDAPACLRAIGWAFVLAALSALASLVLLRVLSGPILSAGMSRLAAIVVLSGALFLLPVLFAGIVSPILTRLALEAAPASRGRVLGQMYALGALGSIFGTLAAGFLFISWIGSIGTMVAVAASYALAGLAFLIARRVTARRTAAGAAAAGIVAGAIVFAGISVDAFQSPCLEESDYYCIRVIDLAAETGRPSAVMVIDHLGHGINDRDEPTRLHSSYMELTDRLVRLRLGRDEADDGALTAFFIGGGAYTLPRAWLAAHPGSRLTVAEIDPAVTRVAREHMWLRPAAGLRVLHEDARAALQETPRAAQFDAVLGDAFHDISIPPHLVTQEFAREVAARLRPGGSYALNVIDSARRPMLVYSIVQTLRPVFGAVEVWADTEQIAGGARITFVVIGGDRATAFARLDSVRPGGPLWLRWPDDDLSRRITASGAPLLSDDYAPVDRLLAPVMEESG